MYFITTKTSAHVDGSKFRVLATTEKRDTARAQAAELNGTVRTQAELDKLIEADRLDRTTLPGYVAPEPVVVEPVAPTSRWVEMAEDVAKTHKTARSLGKKVKAPKRQLTDAAVLAEAVTFIDSIAAESKVAVVRKLAAWVSSTGVALQRRDAMALLNEHVASIANTTISTQWQLVRGGKAKAE